MAAARDVFATKGYHEAKIDDIVAAAKVAKGTFYLYFPDKRSVFSELVDVLFGRLGGAILTVDPSVDVEGQVKHNIRAILAVLLEDPALTEILLSYSAGLDPAFTAKISSFYDGVKALMAASLAEGQRKGIVAPGDTKLFATFTIGALKETLLETAVAKKDRPREEIVAGLFRFLEAGYLRINRAPQAPDARDEPPAPTPSPPGVASAAAAAPAAPPAPPPPARGVVGARPGAAQHQHHRQAEVHAPPEKAHRHRGAPLAAHAAAETEASVVTVLRLGQAGSWLARVIGAVENSVTEPTSASTRLRRQLLIDPFQQLKKLGVLQQRMAHFDGLFSWQTRDSPKGSVCSSSPRGITPLPSRCVIKSAPNAIEIVDRTHFGTTHHAKTGSHRPGIKRWPHSLGQNLLVS